MEITLQFLGAAQNVTGSCYLLEALGHRMLIDCGLYQERQYKDRNWAKLPVAPDKIDTVLLTHAHLDHCGRLPVLVRDGFKGKVVCTPATAELAKIVLADSGKLQEEDAEYKKKRHSRESRQSPYPVKALYTLDDAVACFNRFDTVNYKKSKTLADGITAEFFNTGHILGASAIKITLKLNGETRSVLFSGDVGRWNKPIIKDPSHIEQADYILCESTYGDRVHEDAGEVKEQLAEVINSTYEAGGNIIIPSFAIERSQEVLYYLHELRMEKKIPHVMVFVDSPMAVSVTEVFEKHPELFDDEMNDHILNGGSPFHVNGLSMVRTSQQSKAINGIRGTAVIIAGSGMCTGGRVKHHLVNNVERKESTVLFVGYQAVGTLGRLLARGEKEVRILGKVRWIKSRIAQIHGFSAHGDKQELTRWLSALKQPPKHLFVVHGEAEASAHFAQHVKDHFGWESSVPKHGDVIKLD